jgi:hypothetical protein
MSMAYELAQALFDNFGDDIAGDELSFRRGDIVTVLEKDYQGLDGWWLCSLRGRAAMAPGNYFVILPQEQQQQLVYAAQQLQLQKQPSAEMYDSPGRLAVSGPKRLQVIGQSASLPYNVKLTSQDAVDVQPESPTYSSIDQGDVYDVPATQRSSQPSLPDTDDDVDPPYEDPDSDEEEEEHVPAELTITASAALKSLALLQNRIEPSVKKLNSFVTKHWLKPETLKEKVANILPISGELTDALRQLCCFCSDLSVNAEKATDPNLNGKLEKLREPLEKARVSVRQVLKGLKNETAQIPELQEHLQNLVSACMSLPQHLRDFIGCVRGNSSLLFLHHSDGTETPDFGLTPRSSLRGSTEILNSSATNALTFLRSGLDSSTSPSASMESISDISMSSKRNSAVESQTSPRQSPPPNRRQITHKSPAPPSIDEIDIQNDDEPPPLPPARHHEIKKKALINVDIQAGQLNQGEKTLLGYYSMHMQSMFPELKQAVESLCRCAKEEPKKFVPRAKLVIISSYKFVYVADALFQKIEHVALRNHVVNCSNKLSDVIKQVVEDTKKAATNHPSDDAVKAMLDSVKVVPEAAHALVDSVKEGSEF